MLSRRNIVLTVLIAAIAISGFAFYMQDLGKVNLEPNEQHAGERDYVPDWIGIKRFNDHEVADLTDHMPDNRYLCTGYPEPVVIDADEFEAKVSRVTTSRPIKLDCAQASQQWKCQKRLPSPLI